MTAEKLSAIRSLQLPDQEKRRRADLVVPTGSGRRTALRALIVGLSRLSGRSWGLSCH
jgi:dephospho-CoA kinase